MSAIASPGGQIRGHKLLPEIGSLYASPSSTYYPGGLVGHLPGSNLAIPVTAGVSPDLIIVGYTPDYLITSATVDGNGIALDADGITKLYVRIEDGLLGYFDTGASAHAILDGNRDQPCWASDNNTLYLDNPGGLLPFAGIIHHVDADGSVHVWIRASSGAAALFAPAEAGVGATYDDSAAYVATSLPAGTFSGGVFTATTPGAFSTAQDGVTPALNDKVLVPPGVLGSLTVTAAQSGLYYFSNMGGSGVSMTLTRAPSWQYGATITPMTRIRIQFGTALGGTNWTAEPATASKKVGTDDPKLAPDRVIMSGLLASGTVTLAPAFPLRSTSFVSAQPTGGSPAATTNSIQPSTVTPGAVGTASLVLQAQSHLGALVNTDASTFNVLISQ